MSAPGRPEICKRAGPVVVGWRPVQSERRTAPEAAGGAAQAPRGNRRPASGVDIGMRTARGITVFICAFALVALPAFAKEGVRAELEGTVRLGTAAGMTIPVTWRLLDARGNGFGASGIYLRVSRCGGGLRRVKARSLGGGRFSARVRVPRGGIHRLRVGLEGWRLRPGARAQRADMLFEFDPPLVRRCPAAASST